MIDTVIHLAQVDPVTVDYLAQRAGTGQSGISTVDRLVNTLIRIIGAVIGIGFFVNAAKDGWKGDAKQQGMSSATKIMVGIAIIVLFMFIPNLINEGSGLMGSFL